MKNESNLIKIKQKLQELIETNDIDVDDGFYDVGGNSILAVHFADWVASEFEVELEIKSLFEKNIREITEDINNHRGVS